VADYRFDADEIRKFESHEKEVTIVMEPLIETSLRVFLLNRLVNLKSLS